MNVGLYLCVSRNSQMVFTHCATHPRHACTHIHTHVSHTPAAVATEPQPILLPGMRLKCLTKENNNLLLSSSSLNNAKGGGRPSTAYSHTISHNYSRTFTHTPPNTHHHCSSNPAGTATSCRVLLPGPGCVAMIVTDRAPVGTGVVFSLYVISARGLQWL